MKKYKNGDVVKFVDDTAHRRSPSYYPPAGTLGVITEDGSSTMPGVSWEGWSPGAAWGRFPTLYYHRDTLAPFNGEKILIMRDKKDPMRVIARNLVTDAVGCATCGPRDKFDFNVGAKLALDRLIASEKPQPTGWSGRITFVNVRSPYWTAGWIYDVVDGVLTDDDGDARYATDSRPVSSFEELQGRVPFPIVEIKPR